MAEADEVTVRFRGDGVFADYTLRETELDGIRNILKLYDMVQAHTELLDYISVDWGGNE